MADKSKSDGMGLSMILFLIFLTLKLAEIGPVQYWSWWWITAPLWLPVAALIIAIIIAKMFEK